MLFQNQNRIYGRVFREGEGGTGDKGGSGGEGDKGGDGGGKEPTVKELQEQLAAATAASESATAENSRLVAKIGEANKRKKEAERAAKEAATSKAKADNNYEELFKSSETERENLQTQLDSMNTSNARKEEKGAAMKIATGLAEGANIELLADFIGRRLKYTDEGIKVTNEAGELTVSTLDDLQKEFLGSAQYASLIKGSKSSGGGASGGPDGSGASKEISRSDFDKLDPASRMKFVKDSGKINED